MVRKLLIGLSIFLFVTSPVLLTWAFIFYKDLQERNNPQRQLFKSTKNELLSFNMEGLYPQEVADARDELRQRWLAGIERSDKYLLEGKFNQAQEELVGIQKAIEKASHFDKYMFTKEKILANNPDKNGDRISDWFEGTYQKLSEIIKINR